MAWNKIGNMEGPAGAVGPPGSTGPPGPTGPTAVSTDAGNLARLGSDNLVLVPQTAADGPLVIGASTPQAKFPSGIVVPSFAAHPDRIIASPSAFDDHF